jgi:hypothetical protein
VDAVRGRLVAALVVFLAVAVTGVARGQQKTMPGPLSHAHAALGAGGQCEKCHVPSTWSIEAARCLRCHQPIAERIAAKKGIHREVTGACEACHAEHGGAGRAMRSMAAPTWTSSHSIGRASITSRKPASR